MFGLSILSAVAITIGSFTLFIFLRQVVFKPAVCKSKRRLNGKVVLITGANTGLGKVTAEELAARGATVYMACRNMEKAEQARQDILSKNPEAKLILIKIDLNSLQSVKACAEEFMKENSSLDILVANAGFGAFQHNLTEDDIEWHLGCNHLSHFYLIRLLLPCLRKAGTESLKSRIVVVSSKAHWGSGNLDYDSLQRGKHWHAYGQSKLANILFCRHLSKLLVGENITVNSLHPGVIFTDFPRHIMPVPKIFLAPFKLMTLTPLQGAQTQIWAAVDESLEGVSGKFFAGCAEASTSSCAKNEEEAEKLWRWSCSKTRLPLDL
ncbi:hypothetical protein EB796_023329 [Bugula neritina]|uniref:RDH13 n=1 Tax=Bugula neritina TaxID=10212 RepID=A0A7J7IYS0_BUGNE|nr:hypothetical protein EB796_023329 [Bugula neritina]